jgi:1-deoxyxylulose-5-phosphate synthase
MDVLHLFIEDCWAEREGEYKKGENSMEYKHLGKAGLKVSRLSIGGLVWGRRVEESESIKLIRKAIDQGMTFVDTSDIYGKEDIFLTPERGTSEIVVGKALKGIRESIVLATKLGFRAGSTQNDIGLSRLHIINAVDHQLKRLQTDYIDLYYAHYFDRTTPLEETLRAMDDLVRQGKVRYIGCSNYYAWQLTKALWTSERYNLVRYDCIQSSYNLLSRNIETELLPLCESEGVGVTIWGPLASGLLTGKYKFNENEPAPKRGYGIWQKMTFEAISLLEKAAKASGHTLTQMALAWLLKNPVVTSVISGFTSEAQLQENLSALGVKLTEEELAACDEVGQMLYPAPKMVLPSVKEEERRPVDTQGHYL